MNYISDQIIPNGQIFWKKVMEVIMSLVGSSIALIKAYLKL